MPECLRRVAACGKKRSLVYLRYRPHSPNSVYIRGIRLVQVDTPSYHLFLRSAWLIYQAKLQDTVGYQSLSEVTAR